MKTPALMIATVLSWTLGHTVGCKRDVAATTPKATVQTVQPATADTGHLPKQGSMFAQKPYVTVFVEAQSVPFEVHVNGAPVTSNPGASSRETYPVNQLLRPWGDNEISVLAPPYTLPDGTSGYEDAASVTVTVLVQETGSLDKPGVPVCTLSFHGKTARTPQATEGSSPVGKFDSARKLEPNDRGDVVIGPPRVQKINSAGVLLVSRTFAMPMPLPEWEFLRSDLVPLELEGPTPAGDVLYEQLIAAYDLVWQGLKTGDVDKVLPLFEERSRNTDAAFYLFAGTTQKKLKALLEEAVHDPSLALQPIKADESWVMDVCPTARLMRLVTRPHSGAILRFEDITAPGLATTVPITFRKQGERFVIAL
ncbi:MAG: hypothetical protein RL701_8063 [Pseudomonadota bacterium]